LLKRNWGRNITLVKIQCQAPIYIFLLTHTVVFMLFQEKELSEAKEWKSSMSEIIPYSGANTALFLKKKYKEVNGYVIVL